MTTLLILGATGQVGQQLLRLSLSNDEVSRVLAPTRHALAAHPKLDNPIVDYEHLSADAPWWKADAILCALGTTMRIAGSQEAFYRVDHDYVMSAAKHAKAAGSRCFVLNSSMGAKLEAGSFYLRTKAETERDLAALGFTSLTIVRPSLLDGGQRPERRTGEALALILSRLLGRLIPRRLRPISTHKLALAMIQAALHATPGVTCIESEQLHECSAQSSGAVR